MGFDFVAGIWREMDFHGTKQAMGRVWFYFMEGTGGSPLSAGRSIWGLVAGAEGCAGFAGWGSGKGSWGCAGRWIFSEWTGGFLGTAAGKSVRFMGLRKVPAVNGEQEVSRRC